MSSCETISGVDLFQAWFDNTVVDDYDPLGQQSLSPYLTIWMKWLRFLLNRHNTDNLNEETVRWERAEPTDVLAFLNGPIYSSKPGRRVSDVTRRRYWRLLERVYDFAVEKQWIDHNPAANIQENEKPPQEDHKGAILPDLLWRAVITRDKTVRDSVDIRDNAVLHLLFSCGLAPNEIRSLQLRDVLAASNGLPVALYIKGPGVRQDRKVILPENVACILKKWIELRRSSCSWRNLTALFLSRENAPLSTKTLYVLVQREIKEVADDLGISYPVRMGPQVIRNTVIVHWLNSGVPINIVVQKVGLKDIKGIYRLREHLKPDVRRLLNKS